MMGWISVQTHFLEVKGNIMKLPENTPTSWPRPASLTNCTHHVMEALPGAMLIAAIDGFPDNEVQIDPGIYSIHDTELAGNPQVLSAEIQEGSAVRIVRDGNGSHESCGQP